MLQGLARSGRPGEQAGVGRDEPETSGVMGLEQLIYSRSLQPCHHQHFRLGQLFIVGTGQGMAGPFPASPASMQ